MGLLVLLTAPMLLALILVWSNPPQNTRHRSDSHKHAASRSRHGRRRTTHA
ncbi:hypothetical protein C8250_034390 [Streptomyces sp. So13.3]|uniref:hypothetical protein n=1 Tax=Streptomyces TaxID=1883 RepID=UPI00164E92A5|nr:hypothetical protein [Streptomyces sp. So13.3]QNA76287.1 hypothetical protein C8250_034390 [Streptomyces sp. So13.3]